MDEDWARAVLKLVRDRLSTWSPHALDPPWIKEWTIQHVALRRGDEGLEIGVVYAWSNGAIEDWAYPLALAEPDSGDPELATTIIVANFIEPNGGDPSLDFAVLSAKCQLDVWAGLVTALRRSGETWRLGDMSIGIGDERPELVINFTAGATVEQMRFPLKHGDLIRDPRAVVDAIVSDVVSSMTG